MKTDDLITVIAADAGAVERPVASTLLGAVLVTAVVVSLLFLKMLGVRQDFWTGAMGSWQFWLKFVITLSVMIPAYFLVKDLSRPEASPKFLKSFIWVGPALLAVAIGNELYTLPSDLWGIYTVGSMAFQCVSLIPALSFLPLAAILYALRQGAPANPVVAGAFGGLLSASMGATLYATHCVNDSPLFVSAWYPIGGGIVVALGAILGSRFLKW